MNLDFAKVCGKHNAVYEAYFKQIDPNATGAIEAMTAAKFLKKSGLSDVVLSRVWDMSDPNGRGYLDKPGFFVALKLVSLAQAGQVSNMNNIYLDTANPPKVGEIPKTMPTRIQTVPISSGGVANGDWSISVIDRLKYEQLFESLKPVGNMLPGNKVKGVLMESKLPMDTLGIIWDLADQDKDGNLDKHEFIVAMHLVYQTLQKRTVPNVLPPELRKPGGGGAPPPKPAPPLAAAAVPMPRAPSGEGFSDNGFVANFPKDIAPPAAIPPLPVAVPPMTRIPPVGAVSSQPLINTDPLIPIGAPPSTNVDWVVTPGELQRFEILFRDSDRDKDGLVSGLEVKDVFIQSGVPQKCLAHIWALCDTNQSGKLTIEQFALAMWMVERKRKGIEPPQVLTSNMVPPSMRDIMSGVELQPQEPKPTYSNPELEMISKEIEELARERRALETEIAQKEADVRIKNGEVRSLQSELDTLSATLKQLENQRGEAQKRLDDLQIQVNKIRDQCQKQEETINEQEGELNEKRSELQKLKDEEDTLQKEYDDNNRELTKLTQHLQNTQLQISSVRSMVTQLMETQRQMTDALLICRAAIDNQNAELVSEYQLKIEPDFDDARKTLEKEIEMPKDDPFAAKANENSSNKTINGFDSDPFGGKQPTTTTTTISNTGFDDSFNASGAFDGGFDTFGGSSTFHDPFGGDAFSSAGGIQNTHAVTPEPGKDDFGSDPFAALHAPTGQGQVLTPNAQKSGPPPRPESPSPALPPKKSKVPPPRPAPPRPNQGPMRSTQSNSDAFGPSATSGSFADFADFDNKLTDIPTTLPSTDKHKITLSSTLVDDISLFELAGSNIKSTANNNITSSLSKNNIMSATKTTSATTCTSSATSLILTAATITTTTTNSSTTPTNNQLTRSTTPMQQGQQQQQQQQGASNIFNAFAISSSGDHSRHTNSNISNNINNINNKNNNNKTIAEIKHNGSETLQSVASGPTDFKDDPFKDYRYEDPFNIKDPFADDDDDDVESVFAEPEKFFKDDLSSQSSLDEHAKKLGSLEKPKAATPALSQNILEQFDAFNLNPSPVPSQHSTHSATRQTHRATPTPAATAATAGLFADAFADFDAFSTKSTSSSTGDVFQHIQQPPNIGSSSNTSTSNNNHNNNNTAAAADGGGGGGGGGGKSNTNQLLNDSFFDAFNDDFGGANNNLGMVTTASATTTTPHTLWCSSCRGSKIEGATLRPCKQCRDRQIGMPTANADKFADAFSVPTTTTTKPKGSTIGLDAKLFDAFNDNNFEDDFAKSNKNNNLNTYANNATKHAPKATLDDNFAKFDAFEAHNFSNDFATALNNSINLNNSNSHSHSHSDSAKGAATLSTLKKVQNPTMLAKTSNSVQNEGGAAAAATAAKMPEKFAADYSKPESFDNDLEEALKRSMLDN